MGNNNSNRLIAQLDESVNYCDNTVFSSEPKKRIVRVLRSPIKFLVRKINIKFLRRKYAIPISGRTFWGEKMHMFSFEQGLYLCGFINHDPEVRLSKFMIRNIKEGGVFFDIGSHHGFYSLLINRITRSKMDIHAFEPSPVHFNVLRKNAKKHKNILSNKMALGSKTGEIIFYENKRGISTVEKNVSLRQSKLGHTFSKIIVPTQTLDSYCRENNTFPTFIKIDVEGAESDVIAGGLKVLKKHMPTVVMEVWGGESGKKSHKKAIDMLKIIGYTPFKINKDGTISPMVKIDFDKDFDKKTGFDNFIFKA